MACAKKEILATVDNNLVSIVLCVTQELCYDKYPTLFMFQVVGTDEKICFTCVT